LENGIAKIGELCNAVRRHHNIQLDDQNSQCWFWLNLSQLGLYRFDVSVRLDASKWVCYKKKHYIDSAARTHNVVFVKMLNTFDNVQALGICLST
jgi:hypothetical protein